LGGNVSVAAGPVGRNAEASGAASLRSVAGIFSYSKTKGLFAGVSLEGSVIMERRDANSKFYGSPVTAKQLLNGNIAPPPDAKVLIDILNSRVFRGNATGSNYDDMYHDIPRYNESQDDFTYGDGRRSSLGSPSSPIGSGPTRTPTWHEDSYGRNSEDGYETAKSAQFQRQHFNSTYSDKGPPPGRPTAPKPQFKPLPRASTLGANQAVALYTFAGDQPGDLGFKKGDIITITKRTDSKNDWWTGQIDGRTGIFPSNYVESM